jgi:hypothetical protein
MLVHEPSRTRGQVLIHNSQPSKKSKSKLQITRQILQVRFHRPSAHLLCILFVLPRLLMAYRCVSEGDAGIIVLILWKGLDIIVTADLLRFRSMGVGRQPLKICHLLAFSMQESERVHESQLSHFRLICGCESWIEYSQKSFLWYPYIPKLSPLSALPVKNSTPFPIDIPTRSTVSLGKARQHPLWVVLPHLSLSPVLRQPLSQALGFLVLRYIFHIGAGGLLGKLVITSLAETLGMLSLDCC